MPAEQFFVLKKRQIGCSFLERPSYILEIAICDIEKKIRNS